MHVCIIVPFRFEATQNRAAHLGEFLARVPPVLHEACKRASREHGGRSGTGGGDTPLLHSVHILIVRQREDDGHKFSRGRLLNAGVQLALHGAAGRIPDRFVFHDVDLIPDVDRARGYFAPLCPPYPAILLALNTTGEYRTANVYTGGIVAVPSDEFVLINGFPNELEGWGGEDDAFRARVVAMFGPGAIEEWKEGTVMNLELDPKFVGACRARDNPACKAPKAERRMVRALWAKDKPAGLTGLRELAF